MQRPGFELNQRLFRGLIQIRRVLSRFDLAMGGEGVDDIEE